MIKFILISVAIWCGAFMLCLTLLNIGVMVGLTNISIPDISDVSLLVACGTTAFYAYKRWPKKVVVPVVIPEPEPIPEPAPKAYEYPPMPNIKQSPYYLHGTANWDNPTAIISGKFNKNFHAYGDEQQPFDGIGYYIGDRYKIQPLMHAMTIAGTGQGKGACLILPNLLSVPAGSWFVLDPKGENAAITARFQKDSGQTVIILDPWGEQKRLGATHDIEPSGFNPLSFVRENPDEMAECCAVIANQIVVSDSKDTKGEYWAERARSLIQTYLLHIVTAKPVEEQHLGTLFRWLRLPVPERGHLWVEMFNNLACDELVKAGIGEFIGMDQKEGPLPSIISTAQSNTKFLESTALRESLSKDDFDPYQLTDGKTTVYICLPDRFQITHARWLRLVVGVCLKACNHRPNKRVTFLLDEFALLGKMTDVQNAYAFGRGQNVQLAIFAQSLTQLVEIYGEHGMNTFLSNARIRQFFGVYDLYTQRYLSEYLGDQTVMSSSKSESFGTNKNPPPYGSTGDWIESYSNSTSYSESLHGRRLLSSEEIGRTPGIITLVDGHKFIIPRVPYWSKTIVGFLPKDLSEWRNFVDMVEGRKPFPPLVFPGRADTSTIKIDVHQQGLPTGN